jgi:hypothetical protein
MSIQNTIEKRLKNDRKKLAKLPGRIKRAKKRGFWYRAAALFRAQESVPNLENQQNDLQTDKPVLEFISQINLDDPQKTEKEKNDLYENYNYATKGRNQIRADLYKSQRSEIETQKDIDKATEKLTDLNDDDDGTKSSRKKIRTATKDIGNLGLKQRHHTRCKADATINYEFSKKIISNAGTDPDEIRLLKKNMEQLNHAIKQQKSLQKKTEEKEKKSLKARFLLIKKLNKQGKSINDLPKMDDRPPSDDRGKKKSVLDYVTKERLALDSNRDYLFSKKILEEYAATGETSELKTQFECLNAAIEKRGNYRKTIEAIEQKQLSNYKERKKLKKDIGKLDAISIADRTPKQKKNLAKYRAQVEILTREAQREARKSIDAHQLHDFANDLIDDASIKGDASQLPQLLENLDVAAKRQKEYRGQSETIEKNLLKAEAETVKKAGGPEQKQLNITQLTRQKEDAEQAHLMMNDLIDQAKGKRDPSDLPKQCKQLKKGIDATGKYRKLIEEKENERQEIKVKQGENKTEREKFWKDHKLTSLLPLPAPAQMNPEDLQIPGNLENLSLKKIKKFSELSVTEATLAFSEKQADRRITNATRDHAFAKAFLDKAQADRNPADLPRQFKRMETAIAEQNKFTKRLEEEENKIFLSEKNVLSAEFKVVEFAKKHESKEKALAKIDNADPKYIEKQFAVHDAHSAIKRQELRVTQLQRRARQNFALNNARLNEAEANRILAKILDPSATPEQIRDAKKEFKALARKVKDQNDAIKAAVKDRDKLTERREKEDNKDFERENKILNATLKATALKEKHDRETAKLVNIADKTSPEFIKQQSVVYDSEYAFKKQEVRATQLTRKKKQNLARDQKRLHNANENEEEANQILKRICDPNATPADIATAKTELETLKKTVKMQKEEEEKLAPKDRRKERKKYRKKLEDAEEKRLEFDKEQNLYNIDLLKAENIPDAKQKKAALKKLDKRKARLEAEKARIDTETTDTNLIYDFSDKLLQNSINDGTFKKAEKLEAQFKELKTADQLQRESREEIEAVDKKLNIAPKKREKKQLQRQKNDLADGHDEMQKLIRAAFDKGDTTGLKEQCNALREGIGGTRRNLGRPFGQAINRKALEECENSHSENKLSLKKSEAEKNKAEKTKEKHPNRYKKAFEKYEDCMRLREQSKRRRDDALNDYNIGKSILKAAVADTPLIPNKSDRLADLKKQFSVLQAAVKERNKLTERLEKIEKDEKTTERKYAKNIKAETKKKTSLENDIVKANVKLRDLTEADSPNPKAIEKQQAYIDKLQETLDNKTAKIDNLTQKAADNAAAYSARITEVKKLHVDANDELATVTNSVTLNNKPLDVFKNKLSTADKEDATKEKQRKTEQEKQFSQKEKETTKENAAVRKKKDDERKVATKTRKEAAAADKKAKKEEAKAAKGEEKSVKKGISDKPAAPQVVPAVSVAARATPPVAPAPPNPVVPTPPGPPAPQKPPLNAVKLPANSIRVPVHTSKIAQAQAIYKLAELTKCKLENGGAGKLLLKDASGKLKGTFLFHDDANGQRQMTATFTKPIDPHYIEATALFAAHNQPNDRNKENKQWHHTFTQKDLGLPPDVDVDSIFTGHYEKAALNPRRSIVGNAIAEENEKIRLQPELQVKQIVDEQPPSKHGGAKHSQ